MIRIPLPDLLPTGLAVQDAQGIEVCDLWLKIMVANQGDAPAINVEVHFLLDNVFSDRIIIPYLEQSETKLILAMLNGVTDGTHIVTIVMDPYNAIIESREKNNERDWTINVWAHSEEELERCIDDCWGKCHWEYVICLEDCEEYPPGYEYDQCVAKCEEEYEICKDECEWGCKEALDCQARVR
jgi:hypothetical protein